MGFMPEGSLGPRVNIRGRNPLTSVVRLLSPTAKQAMFAAAQKNMIARGTWDGCAFNQAGDVVGPKNSVRSSGTAAQAFGMSTHDVDRFISTWDNLGCSDYEANRYLIEALSEVGTHTPTGASGGRRIVRGYAYKSAATKFAEQLESGELTVDMIPGCEEAAQLLSATC